MAKQADQNIDSAAYTHHRFKKPCEGIEELGGKLCKRDHDCLGHVYVIAGDPAVSVNRWFPCFEQLHEGSDYCPEHQPARRGLWTIIEPNSGLILWRDFQHEPLTSDQFTVLLNLAEGIARTNKLVLAVENPAGERMAFVYPDTLAEVAAQE